MAEQRAIVGNSLDVLKTLPQESVDVCVTSPPYWSLRDYGVEPTIWGGDPDCEHDWCEHIINREGWYRNRNVGSAKVAEMNNRLGYTLSHFCSKCNAWKGQLGLEPNPLDYIEHLCMIFDEVKMVLKPTGACWVNLGDTYNGNKTGNTDTGKNGKVLCDTFVKQTVDGIGQKSLCQIPSRFAIAMTDRGWILRNEIIWHRPNVMPQSMKDRFTVDFEKFFFFVKQPRYYFKQQLEPVQEISIKRAKGAGFNSLEHHDRIIGTNPVTMEKNDPNWKRFANPEGRNCRTTWSINTHGEHYGHIAMFPEALIERPIDSCCPPGGTVMDIFAGSGTVLAYCRRNNIDAIGIDINPINEDIINRRMDRAKDARIKDLTNWI